jgi:RimJ/RimL family protein N-acetyltransferase
MINTRAVLQNKIIKLIPLEIDHFEDLYKVASDHKIWEQHPNKNRYQKEVFKNFFEGAIQSKGAYLIVDLKSEEICGSTRFYDYNEKDNSILIGYTFLATRWWGKGINPSVKTLMFDTAFEHVNQVILHIGETNHRSQIAIERLGAKKIDLIEVAYFGESVKTNLVYSIEKNDWNSSNKT